MPQSVRMPFHYSLKVAHALWGLIRIPRELVRAQAVTVEAWGNGREQGYSVWIAIGPLQTWARVNFAQARSSDSILVIHGPAREFDSHNQPSEALWDNPAARFYLDGADQRAVARFIEGLITTYAQVGLEAEAEIHQRRIDGARLAQGPVVPHA